MSRAERRAVRPAQRRGASLALSLALSGCAGGVTSPADLQVSCPRALLGLDQLGDPGFVVQDPVHLVTPADLGLAAAPKVPRPRQAAEVRYFRQLRDLATSNGPIDISARASCYPDGRAASLALAASSAVRDGTAGETPVATGPLGDEAHGDLRQASTPAGTPVAQVTLEWRLASVVNRLVVRGRTGAYGLSDVLALAARQDENELALPSPQAG